MFHMEHPRKRPCFTWNISKMRCGLVFWLYEAVLLTVSYETLIVPKTVLRIQFLICFIWNNSRQMDANLQKIDRRKFCLKHTNGLFNTGLRKFDFWKWFCLRTSGGLFWTTKIQPIWPFYRNYRKSVLIFEQNSAKIAKIIMRFQGHKNSSESAKIGDRTALFGGSAVCIRVNFPCTHRRSACAYFIVELWIKIVDNCGNVNSFKERLRSFMYRNTLFSQYICRK